MDNLIKEKSALQKFRDDRFSFIVSSRRITPDVSAMDYLKIHYIYIKPEQIKHVFGSVTIPSRLYGGRKYDQYHSLTESHIKELNENGIGVSLNLTNHFFDRESYEESFELLDKFHSPQNSIIITNDELAGNIRRDFPGYKLKASIIKNITSIRRLEKAFRLYDYVTLPMDLNDDDDFLKSISQKERIILFANANCAYKCPARTCYYGFSQHNRGEEITSFCSKETMPRLDHGPVYFDAEKLGSLGFTNFKLVPLFFEEADKVTKYFSWTKKQSKYNYKKPDALIISYPKSGRTWLRFILANYFNDIYNLGENVDLHNFFTLLPNDTDDGQRGLEAYKYYENKDVPFIIFSHEKSSRIDYSGKSIFLLRSPYDVMTSDYFQQTEHLKRFKGTIKEFIRHDKKGINKFCDFLNSFSSTISSEDTFVTSYEELSNNAQEVLRNLLGYLNLTINENILAGAINKSSFSLMQNLEKEQGLPYLDYDLENNHALRMRGGKTDGYKEYLDENDINFIDSTINEKLEKEILLRLKEHDCFEYPETQYS